MTKLSDATRNKLKTVSTATVATALFKRGFRIQMIQDVHPLGPAQPVLVGEAFTLRYMPAREDLNKIDVFRDRAHPQRKAIEDCPPGAVLVMDSRKDARAASAGAILVTRLMKRGVAGVYNRSTYVAEKRAARFHSFCATISLVRTSSSPFFHRARAKCSVSARFCGDDERPK
jgi:hypothetical protein